VGVWGWIERVTAKYAIRYSGLEFFSTLELSNKKAAPTMGPGLLLFAQIMGGCIR
jgi:hypothetical protein